jgi:hypothetical protein
MAATGLRAQQPGTLAKTGWISLQPSEFQDRMMAASTPDAAACA